MYVKRVKRITYLVRDSSRKKLDCVYPLRLEHTLLFLALARNITQDYHRTFFTFTYLTHFQLTFSSLSDYIGLDYPLMYH